MTRPAIGSIGTDLAELAFCGVGVPCKSVTLGDPNTTRWMTTTRTAATAPTMIRPPAQNRERRNGTWRSSGSAMTSGFPAFTRIDGGRSSGEGSGTGVDSVGWRATTGTLTPRAFAQASTVHCARLSEMPCSLTIFRARPGTGSTSIVEEIGLCNACGIRTLQAKTRRLNSLG